MKRTSVSLVVVLALVGGVVGGFLEAGLTAGGRPIIIPPLTFPLALAVIGGIVVALAVPIRRFTRGHSHEPIDAYYATRVLVLAKASALIGAICAGFGLGITVYLLTRSVVPVGSVASAVVTFVGAGALLAGGLIAEHFCTIPPSDDDDEGDKRAIRVRP
ncbi:MAG: hypothetical protein JWN36_2904 [Microbacteriaceae bacterium]|nr:hypothetical protein [Microbacteriaceae bacterium]